MTYDWMAMLATLGLVVVMTKIGQFLSFKVPAFIKAREYNREQDAIKKAIPKYRPMIEKGKRVGLATNVVFFLACVPFFASFESQAILPALVDIVVILMVYDFFYYATHRWLFHGQGYFRRIHAVHHQARTPTHIDAYYVHPLEVLVGLALFLAVMTLLGLFMGPFHVVTIAVTYVAFTQINIINHTHTEIAGRRYSYLNYLTRKHHIHHIDMQHGNYSTITLLYDKLFGTLD